LELGEAHHPLLPLKVVKGSNLRISKYRCNWEFDGVFKLRLPMYGVKYVREQSMWIAALCNIMDDDVDNTESEANEM
jgi:hypothetical protein